MLPPYDTGALE
jgi:hypothetical protein